MKTPLLLASLRGYAIIIAVLGVLTPLLLFEGLKPVLADQAMEDLSTTAAMLRGALAPSLREGDISRADSIARLLSAETGVRITVMDPEGRVIIDTDAVPSAMESHRTRPEVISALNTGRGAAIRRSATLDSDMLYSAVLVGGPDDPAAVVRASRPFRTLSAVLSGIGLKIAILAAVAVALSALVAWHFSRSIAKPVGRLAEAFEAIEGGDYSTRLEPSRISELDSLASGFNQAADRTGSLVSELSERNSQFRATLESAYGPIAVLRRGGRLAFANRSFRSLGAGVPMEDRDYREVISSSDLLSALGRALSSGEPGQDKVQTGGRIWAFAYAPVPGLDQVIVSMADVTEMENLAATKRDFAVNVAHELRTPLTAIKGFAETLFERTDAEGRKYLETILRNTDRLIALVRDVQTLAQIESPGFQLDLQPVDLRPVLGLTVELFSHAAAEKGLELSLETGEVPPVAGDVFRLQQVFINLLDNAVKYTETGAVRVSLAEQEGQAVVVVADTGPGIPPEAVPRLCERFFVVDQARSRQVGGTGLGLAIVKHILMLHGGSLSIRSEPRRGSTFSVRLPLHEDAGGAS